MTLEQELAAAFGTEPAKLVRCLVEELRLVLGFATAAGGLELSTTDGPILVTAADGHSHTCDTSRPGELGPLLSLLNRPATSLGVDERGTIRVRFADGASIAIEADPRFEAWEVLAPNGWQYISLAGGTVDAVKSNRSTFEVWRPT